MATTSISRMQHRRGLKSDLPIELAEGEFGWCLDTRELYIGNSPGFGLNTPVLTQFSNNSDLIKNKWQTASLELASATARSLGSKLNDIASVKDFGAMGDGITDDAPAINAAIAELFYSEGTFTPANYSTRVFLYFPAGIYKISIPLLLYPYVGFIGDGIGKSIIQPIDDTLPYMFETADSMGNTGSNIGGSAGILPARISIIDLTFDTNGNKMDIGHLTRYQSTRFENVEFKGGYQSGEPLISEQKGLYLRSIGDVIQTYDAQVINCTFSNLQYSLYADDPVSYTTVSRCTFADCFRAINFGELANFDGPKYTTVSMSKFIALDGAGISCFSSNPGISSLCNTFVDLNLIYDTSAIYWETGTSLNSSIGDVFDITSTYIENNGSTNLILDAQQNNLVANSGFKFATSSPVTVATTDYNIFIKMLVPGPVTVNLPNLASVGSTYVIKDAQGDAFINNITIVPPSGTIDGSATAVINTNYSSITLIFDGSNWGIV